MKMQRAVVYVGQLGIPTSSLRRHKAGYEEAKTRFWPHGMPWYTYAVAFCQMLIQTARRREALTQEEARLVGNVLEGYDANESFYLLIVELLKRPEAAQTVPRGGNPRER